VSATGLTTKGSRPQQLANEVLGSLDKGAAGAHDDAACLVEGAATGADLVKGAAGADAAAAHDAAVKPAAPGASGVNESVVSESVVSESVTPKMKAVAPSASTATSTLTFSSDDQGFLLACMCVALSVALSVALCVVVRGAAYEARDITHNLGDMSNKLTTQHTPRTTHHTPQTTHHTDDSPLPAALFAPRLVTSGTAIADSAAAAGKDLFSPRANTDFVNALNEGLSDDDDEAFSNALRRGR